MLRNPNEILAGLRAYLRDGQNISAIKALSAGHSSGTYLLEGIDRVLRTPPADEAMLLPPYDMARQHGILAAVAGSPAGPPVPTVFELCTDPDVIGEAFFLMERLEGEAFEFHVPTWLARQPETNAHWVCQQWFDALTKLHRMSPDAFPPGGRSVQDEARHWRDVALSAEAPGLLVDVLEDVVQRPPRTSGPPTPIHGDAKHGNCLWNEGRLVALLDWELAQIGEPLLDLGYILMFQNQGEAGLGNAGYDLPGWWSAEQMVTAWERGTGRSAIDVDRYTILGQAKIAAIISMGYDLYRSGRSSDTRLEGWGAILPPFLALLAERAEAAG